MRFVAFLNLFFYFFMSLHTSFDGHVQVLCVEKDGHIAIETFELGHRLPAQNSLAHDDSTSSHHTEPAGQSKNCTDYYMGTGHADTLAIWSSADLNLHSPQLLQVLLPVITSPPPVPLTVATTPTYPPLDTPSPTLIHIPSTVLLI